MTSRLNRRIGRAIGWLSLVMVLLGAFNAIVRYLGRFVGANLSSNAYIELQWYLFSAIFLLAAAYALERDAHVRVDVLYGRLSKRGKAWIDLGGTVLFLLPFCLFALWVSWPTVAGSWRILESSPDPGGLPRYPLKTLIPIGFALVIVQGLATLIENVAVLRGVALPPLDDPGAETEAGEGLGHL